MGDAGEKLALEGQRDERGFGPDAAEEFVVVARAVAQAAAVAVEGYAGDHDQIDLGDVDLAVGGCGGRRLPAPGCPAFAGPVRPCYRCGTISVLLAGNRAARPAFRPPKGPAGIRASGLRRACPRRRGYVSPRRIRAIRGGGPRCGGSTRLCFPVPPGWRKRGCGFGPFGPFGPRRSRRVVLFRVASSQGALSSGCSSSRSRSFSRTRCSAGMSKTELPHNTQPRRPGTQSASSLMQ